MERQNRKRSGAVLQNPILPMAHHIAGEDEKAAITESEWKEWVERHHIHLKGDSEYERGFNQPTNHRVRTILKWLKVANFPVEHFQKIQRKNHRTFMTKDQINRRNFNSDFALLLGIESFALAAIQCRIITFTEVFDSIVQRTSDNFLAKSAVVSSVRELTVQSILNCRRDLILCGIDVGKIWKYIKDNKANLLFSAIKQPYKNKGCIWSVKPKDKRLLGTFLRSMGDIRSSKASRMGLTLWMQGFDRPENSGPSRAKVRAEYEYDKIELNARSQRLVDIQEAVTLGFDTDEFKKDYDRAEVNLLMAIQKLQKFGVDPTLENTPQENKEGWTIWSKRESDVFYRSIENAATTTTAEYRRENYGIKNPTETIRNLLLKEYTKHIRGFSNWLKTKRKTASTPHTVEEFYELDEASSAWRKDVEMLLDQYDVARQHLSMFAHVYYRVQRKSGVKLIRSKFCRLISKRFQPVHMWPTYVTSKNGFEEQQSGDVGNTKMAHNEASLASYRARWFCAPADVNGKNQKLVGFDISSSQMQIIATLLGDSVLESESMNPNKSFKKGMAERVWAQRDTLLSASKAVRSYSGPDDKRLQSLVKELIMRVSYGSKSGEVEKDERSHPGEFGPGWESGGATEFITKFNRDFPKIALFRQACKKVAIVVMELDEYSGVRFHDPSDGAEVRWNPIRIANIPVRVKCSNNFVNIYIPDGLISKNGEFPVDGTKLARRVMPCLVHMLDAYYSALVMENLAKLEVKTFVGIHDCWLVPEEQLSLLVDAMTLAAKTWYQGLGPLYDDLLNYLRGTGKMESLISQAKEIWVERYSYFVPQFQSKPSPPI